LLVDGNSLVNIDPTSAAAAPQRGMNLWTVDGVNQVAQQWYWFRIGNAAEQSIDSIGAPIVTQFSPNYANIAYTNNVLRIDLSMSLTGGMIGSHTADVAETLRVTNLTGNALDFHAFEYDDFNLSGTPADDRAQLLNTSTIAQWDNVSQVTVGAVPIPGRWQIDQTPGILNLLTDGVASNLTDQVSPLGPTDCSFAFQWDKAIGAHSSMILSKDKLFEVSPVPEPSAIAGLLGVGAFLLRRRSR
jgi:hypothetical protein